MDDRGYTRQELTCILVGGKEPLCESPTFGLFIAHMAKMVPPFPFAEKDGRLQDIELVVEECFGVKSFSQIPTKTLAELLGMYYTWLEKEKTSPDCVEP